MDSLSAPEPYVLDLALRNLERRNSNADPKALRERASTLSHHEHAAVSGAAVALLAKLGATSDDVNTTAVAKDIRDALSSPHAFVRAQAADAVVRLRYADAVPALLTLLDDAAVPEAELQSWQELEGTPSTPQQRVSQHRSVREAALLALPFRREALRSLRCHRSGRRTSQARHAPCCTD
jgi:HEAT repeat protein